MNQHKDYWNTRLKEWAGLDVTDRLSEVLFGLIMVLTFTGTISVSTAGRQEVDQLLWAALGCNLAWGLVDAIMYMMDLVTNRLHGATEIRKIQQSADPAEGRRVIRDNMSPLISDLMEDPEVDQLGEKMKRLPPPMLKHVVTSKDFFNAIQIFLLVFLSTFPVAFPFMIIQEVDLSIRISNAVALLMLFGGGFALARYTGMKPFKTALIYASIGILLVSITMALGG